MTPKATEAIKATVDKLRDLAEKGRGSEYFLNFGSPLECPLCVYAKTEPCPVFVGCGGVGVHMGYRPCDKYAPPGHIAAYSAVATFALTGQGPLSIATLKAWCNAAATDLEQRFLGGE